MTRRLGVAWRPVTNGYAAVDGVPRTVVGHDPVARQGMCTIALVINDDDAHRLRRLRQAHQQAMADADSARLAFYRELVAIADQGATQEQLAAVLNISRGRVSQLLARAREALR